MSQGDKGSGPWWYMFVRFPPLFVTPSGEQIALPMCWSGTSLSTISRVFVPMYFSGQSVEVDVDGVAFWLRAVVVGRGVVAWYTRVSSREYVHEK